jgi:hypothetical protein
MANVGRVRFSTVLRLFPLVVAAVFGTQVVRGLASVSVSPAPNASAVFRGSDTTTQGNWPATYGAQGYALINAAVSYPTYAQVVVSGTPFTWAASTKDVRALQRPKTTHRVAACWYAATSFTIDVNLTDGDAHQVALYALDWDAIGRAERIDVLDAMSGALLDSRTVGLASAGGQYLVWTLSGHVVLRVTNSDVTKNAVISGLFFDAGPAVAAVTLLAPGTGTRYTAPATISLAAVASVPTGKKISRVDFLNGTTVIGSIAGNPETLSYTLSWTNLVAGTASLTARVTDNTGATGTSLPVTVTMAAKAIPPSVAASAASAQIVRATDLVYQGAFRLPKGPVGGSSFDYGGTALAFNPVGSSLFMVGHDWQQQVAEVSVPAIRLATRVADLATASVLQPFTDATEGRMSAVGPNTVKVGGLLPYRGQLYLTAYLYYDGDGSQTLSHFVSGLDLRIKGDVRGPYHVGSGSGAGLVAGYFGLVPAEWQATLGGPVLNGQCCLSVIGRTSFGPAAFTIDPSLLGRTNPLPATPLVYYTQANPLDDKERSVLFNLTTEIGGVVFPEGTRSVLFFGRQGLGKYCYGEAADCSDPAVTSKGGHAFPYASYVWAYDAVDLAAVKSGKRQPWDVKPYAVWELELPFDYPNAQIRGAAYDPQTGRIFLSAAGDGDNPLIHVFTVRR